MEFFTPMTRAQLLERFPQAGESFLRANCSDHPRSAAIMECGPLVKPLAEDKIEKENPERFRVCVTSIRKRLLDEDNLCEKYHVDCLRRAGYIPDDNPEVTTIEVRQRRCQRGEPERIEIVIERLL